MDILKIFLCKKGSLLLVLAIVCFVFTFSSSEVIANQTLPVDSVW